MQPHPGQALFRRRVWFPFGYEFFQARLHSRPDQTRRLCASFRSETIATENNISQEFVEGLVLIACHINRTVDDDRGLADSARFRRWR